MTTTPTQNNRASAAPREGGTAPRRAAARRRAEGGLSLVELLIVVAVITIVAALALPKFSGRDAGTNLGRDVARRIRERRAAAMQLNSLASPTQLEEYVQPPVTIDFADPETTRSLRLEGTDADNNGTDDITGLALTRFIPPAAAGGTGTWSYAYEGSSLSLPTGWRLAATATELSPIPTIPLGTPVTAVSFGPSGLVTTVTATAGTTDPARQLPFPAVYFTDGTDSVAVAVHRTGLTEFWRWDSSAGTWRGHGDRTVATGN